MSVHTFILGPVGLVYVGAYAELSRGLRGGPSARAAVLACPLFALAAFGVLLV
ncbi:MAG: hypothetical protein M3O70_00180 [Actinomycetota bacterium]|nr:hypothetical protein [Actinomycetota bacterium]